MTIIQVRPKAMQLTQLRDQRVNGLGTALGLVNFYNGATRDDTAPLVVLVFKISCLSCLVGSSLSLIFFFFGS